MAQSIATRHTFFLRNEKQMSAAQRGKTETDRAIDYIVRVLKDCERLKRDISKTTRPSPPVKRRKSQSAQDVGRIGKK
jgi:hypothetical protein